MEDQKTIHEKGWESPISVSKHATDDDLNVSHGSQDTEDEFHSWEDDSLKRSLESLSGPLEGTSKSHVHGISQAPVVPTVQRKKLEPLPRKHRQFKKVMKTKRMRKSKRKKRSEVHCSPSLPIPLVPPQSEEDEVADTMSTLAHTETHNPDLPNKVSLQSYQNEGACVVLQESQIQPFEFSMPQESGHSSTSLASPPPCFGCFLGCICQIFSRFGCQESSRRKVNTEDEAEDDVTGPEPSLLEKMGQNRVQPHQNL